MNYRHAYHAGNFADVLKHAVLCWIVRYLQQKEAPLKLLDTHAGAGIYDLTGPAAAKTGEAKDGVLRLINQTGLPPALAPYLDLIRATNQNAPEVRLYPGSTALMTALARRQDSVTACELHPEDAEALKRSVSSPRLRIVTGDGYRTLLNNVPPPEKRGLVLIDPPFEEPDEFERLAATFIAAHRKWPTGVYILWFPLKHPDDANRFKTEIQSAGIKKLILATLDVARSEGLGATGLILCNAPFTFEAEWRPALDVLTKVLAQGLGSRATVERLNGD